MPEAAPPGAPPTAVAPTPATAGAATPPAPPAATEAPKPATPPTPKPPTKRLDGVQRKAYQTRPAPHAVAPAAAPPAPPTTKTEAETANPADGATPPAPITQDKPAEAAAEAKPAEEPKPSEKLTEAEEARRLARIHKAEAKLAADRQAFAREREAQANLAQRVQIIEKAAAAAKQDPIGFLHRAFGIAPQAVLDAIIADGSKPEATKAAEKSASEAAELRAKLADIEKTVQDSEKARQQESHRQGVAAYKTSAIAPVLADKAKYELTLRALGEQAAVDEVYALQAKRFALTSQEVAAGKRQAPDVLTPAQAADQIEAYLRSQRDLLTGTSVAPGKSSQPTARTEPPAVQPSGSQTQKPAAPSGNGIFKPTAKPYTVRAAR